MKILITGSTGLLGQALVSRFASRAEVVGLSRHAPPEGTGAPHVVCDLADKRQVAGTLKRLQPDVVIHAQALSDVDRCEREPTLARSQNVETTRHLIEALQSTPAILLHVSTDYVFDGAKGKPYVEGDLPCPLSVYGRTKLQAEAAALEYPQGIVIRTSTLFGPGRKNFCDTLIRAANTDGRVEVFTDQSTSPTYTADVAEALELLVRVIAAGGIPLGSRLFHAANQGVCTRLEFAHRVMDLLGASRSILRPIRMAEQHREAARPPYCALKTTKLPELIGKELRSWEDALEAYLRHRPSSS